MGSPANFKVCPNCKTTLMLSATECTQCHMQFQPPQYGPYPRQPQGYGYVDPNRWLIAMLLAFFLGHWGVHRFYMGYNALGGVMLGLWLLGFATVCLGVGFIILGAVWLWALVEFIVICCNGLPMADGTPLK